LVGWWRGEMDALDALGLDNGTLYGGPGWGWWVGYAFDLNGTSAYVDVPDNAILDPTAAITVEAWINPQPPLNSFAPIVKKAGEGQGTDHGYSLELYGPSAVAFWVFLNGSGWIPSPAVAFTANQWNHVAGVYDGSSVALYLNGQLVGTPTYAPGLIVASGNHLQIGHDPSNPGRYFHGLIDEPSVYNRALSAGQIQAIYSAGSVGKCLGPVIVTQPQSQQAPVGANVSLSVVAGGLPPLSYQWYRNGQSLAGATASTLALSNVQLSDSGTYTVAVGNPYGSAVSDPAVLTVYVPTCVPPPAGLVGWWAGEGNTYDSLCVNNGTFYGVATFGAGMVGQAFDLDGSSRYVDVGNGAGLSPTAAITIEGWIYPRLPLDPVAAPVLKKAGGGGYYGQDNGYSLELAGSSSIRFWLFLDNGLGWTGSASAPLSANQWSHVAGVYDGVSISVYVNGVLVGPAIATSGQIVSSAHNLQIGHDPSNPRYFNGLIDEASLYNRALSASEIQAIYASGIAGKCILGAGPHVIGLQDGAVLSGVYQLQAAFCVDSGTLTQITVSDDGAAFEGCAGIVPTNGVLTCMLDTTRMTNGPHNLQLIAYVTPTNAPPPTPDGSDHISLEAPPVSIVVSNEISFPYVEPLYYADSQAMYIQARSAHPNATWWVDIYGDQNNYIGTLTGQTVGDGLIPVIWTLLDPYGRLRTDAFFTPVVRTAWTDSNGHGQAQAVGAKVWRGYDYFPSQGDWVVANQQAWQGWNNADTLDGTADAIASGARGAGFNVLPAGSPGEAFRIPVTGDFSSAWRTFYNAITNFSSRNLYYLGHGANSTLGGYTPAGNGNGLSATELGTGLRNLPWYGGLVGHPPQPNPQRYRFVFIDGCEGADSGLPFLFGITNNRDPELHPYQPGEARPSAFLGFEGDVAIGIRNTGIYLYRPNYVSHLFILWSLNGLTLKAAREQAATYADASGFPLSRLKIVGYKDLGFVEADFK
jgi:hypothetical protein